MPLEVLPDGLLARISGFCEEEPAVEPFNEYIKCHEAGLNALSRASHRLRRTIFPLMCAEVRVQVVVEVGETRKDTPLEQFVSMLQRIRPHIAEHLK